MGFPPSVDAGSIKKDHAGREARNTVTQELLVAQRSDDINVQFQYNVPVNEVTSEVVGAASGTGSILHSGSQARASTGTGVGSAYVASKDAIRYFPGHEFGAEMTANLSAGHSETNVNERWGIGDPGGVGDCMCFGRQNGVFGIFFRSAGVEQFISQANFSEDPLDGSGPSGFDVNEDKFDLYTFSGGWYGILPLAWGIYAGKENGYITCHVIDQTNETEAPHLSNPTLPVFFEVERTSGTGSDITVDVASMRGGIAGIRPNNSANRTQVQFVEAKAIAGGSSPAPVITLRNNSTFQSKQNNVRVRYGTVALATDGTKSVIWEVYKNGSLTGAVFVPQNTATSVVDYDVSATAITGGDGPIGGTIMGKVDTARINLFEGDVILAVYPGETITLTARSANSTSVDVFFRWIEEF